MGGVIEAVQQRSGFTVEAHLLELGTLARPVSPMENEIGSDR